uniref:Uncharacterized protein n=1 Tax=Retropinna nidovirus TaxID=3064111 RepID=A0AA50AG03_9NIDO|nr:MAG: hypothetical protein [Retropinna nidovirus]
MSTVSPDLFTVPVDFLKTINRICGEVYIATWYFGLFLLVIKAIDTAGRTVKGCGLLHVCFLGFYSRLTSCTGNWRIYFAFANRLFRGSLRGVTSIARTSHSIFVSLADRSSKLITTKSAPDIVRFYDIAPTNSDLVEFPVFEV